jgi:hypothetical protein
MNSAAALIPPVFFPLVAAHYFPHTVLGLAVVLAYAYFSADDL